MHEGKRIARAPFDGRYDLERQLGRGSTGTVWEARDRLTSQVVAVKVIQPHLVTSPSAQRRFLREVASARSLRHPHTVQVLAHGRTPEGNAYLVMERLAGVTLSSRLAETGALEQQRAIKIVAQILDAAGAAHRLQIVHRDLKPSNVVLIEQDGDPDFAKVCDFGLAKAIEVEDVAPNPAHEGVRGNGSTVTEVGEICGTPAYMAPEQARGEELDARADLYAVGVLLFEAVVGRVPFSGRSTLAVISQHLSAAPPRPSSLRPELRIFPPLENLLLRALAKNRADRPSSAEVFRADLLQIERDLARELRHTRARPAPTSRIASGDEATLLNGIKRGVDERRWTVRPHVRLAAAGGAIFALVAMSWFGWRRLVAEIPGAVRVSTLNGMAGSPTGPVATAPSGMGNPNPIPMAFPLASESQLPATVEPSGAGHTPIGEERQAQSRALSGASEVETRGRAHRQVTSRRPSRPPLLAGTIADPGESELLIARAEAVLVQGRIFEACQLGREASRLAPLSTQAWEFLGRCYMRLGQPGEARVAYRRYLDIAPDGPNAIFVRAMIGQERP